MKKFLLLLSISFIFSGCSKNVAISKFKKHLGTLGFTCENDVCEKMTFYDDEYDDENVFIHKRIIDFKTKLYTSSIESSNASIYNNQGTITYNWKTGIIKSQMTTGYDSMVTVIIDDDGKSSCSFGSKSQCDAAQTAALARKDIFLNEVTAAGIEIEDIK